MFTETSYIGIDPSSGSNSVAYAAIDGNLKPEAIGMGHLDEALAYAGGRQHAFVAVHAPARPNLGILVDPAMMEQLALPIKDKKGIDMRLAEYQMTQRDLPVYQTPRKKEAAKSWMRAGYKLYERLQALGYSIFPYEGNERQLMETVPEACFHLWLPGTLLHQRSLEGCIQRQAALYDFKIEIPDPMEYYQEVTRHRIMMGSLPREMVYQPAEIQALAAAYVAWLAVNQPQSVEMLGDKNEGQIVLPIKNNKEIDQSGDEFMTKL